MIILITVKEKIKNITYDIVSHGIDSETLQNIVLQNEPIGYYINKCGACFNPNIGEYVIY